MLFRHDGPFGRSARVVAVSDPDTGRAEGTEELVLAGAALGPASCARAPFDQDDALLVGCAIRRGSILLGPAPVADIDRGGGTMSGVETSPALPPKGDSTRITAVAADGAPAFRARAIISPNSRLSPIARPARRTILRLRLTSRPHGPASPPPPSSPSVLSPLPAPEASSAISPSSPPSGFHPTPAKSGSRTIRPRTNVEPGSGSCSDHERKPLPSHRSCPDANASRCEVSVSDEEEKGRDCDGLFREAGSRAYTEKSC